MGVFRVKSRDLWAVKWREDGRQRVLYYKTEQEARAAEAERLAAQDTDPRPTVGELVVAFYRHNPRHERTKRNVVYFLAGYEKDGKHIEGPGEFLRDRYAETLTRRDLEMMRDNMRARNPRVTNATINKYQAYLKGIFSWAVEQELLPFHPWRFKLLKHIKTPVHVSVDSLTRIYQELPDYMQWAVKTALCLVLRPGLVELFGLRWEAFDWRRGIVYIQSPRQPPTCRRRWPASGRTCAPASPMSATAGARRCCPIRKSGNLPATVPASPCASTIFATSASQRCWPRARTLLP